MSRKYKISNLLIIVNGGTVALVSTDVIILYSDYQLLQVHLRGCVSKYRRAERRVGRGEASNGQNGGWRS